MLADAIRDGGFPPLLLDPIDFGALYLQQADHGWCCYLSHASTIDERCPLVF